ARIPNTTLNILATLNGRNSSTPEGEPLTPQLKQFVNNIFNSKEKSKTKNLNMNEISRQIE
ncbi:hypothetical protein, partial [Chlamydia gallinacea]|uniref:hypothetical protein n=1 Tax=Chlamydia gallinacea TaxID=1457153 RepID=UPI001C83B9B8